MRIGIDVRALSTASGRRGVGTYIRSLTAALAQEVRGTSDSIILFDNGSGDSLPQLDKVTRVKLMRPRRGITLWDQVAWPPTLAARRVDVFHSPFYAVPRVTPPRCRVVQTVHDLTPLKLPDAVSPRQRKLFRFNFQLARTAHRLIVPSEATRTDVISLLGVPSERIIVIPEAADITPADVVQADARIPQVLRRLRIGRAYLLHTGGHDAVKNLPRLLSAFTALIQQGRDLELVIAGEHGPGTSDVIQRASILGVLDRVRLPGFVPREDLIPLYRGALALVYPSRAEGFGLPVVEAMTCGLPVVASRAGPLPEVGGDACLYVDAASAAEMTQAVSKILDAGGLAADLARKGRARAAQFTWRETARRTLAVYREVAA